MAVKSLVRHWKAKAVTQKLISALPAASRVNYVFQRHVTGTAKRTADWYGTNLGQARRHLQHWQDLHGDQTRPAHALELGTGWHITVPLCLALWGVEAVTTVDRTSLLQPQRLADGLRLLRQLIDSPAGEISVPVDPDRWQTLGELAEKDRVFPEDLQPLGITIAVGDLDEIPIPPRSIDLFTSNNVLEHVSPTDLANIFRTYRSLATDTAVMSHFIDLADHFSAFDPTISSRNFLRYSDRQWRRWDNDLVPQNRLQIVDYRAAHVAAGFNICSEELTRAPRADLLRFTPAEEFAAYAEEDLLVDTAWIASQPCEPYPIASTLK